MHLRFHEHLWYKHALIIENVYTVIVFMYVVFGWVEELSRILGILLFCGFIGSNMSLARDMLIEEKEGLKEIISQYQSIIKKYPRGSIVKKEIKNRGYAYLNYRKDGRHHSFSLLIQQSYREAHRGFLE